MELSTVEFTRISENKYHAVSRENAHDTPSVWTIGLAKIRFEVIDPDVSIRLKTQELMHRLDVPKSDLQTLILSDNSLSYHLLGKIDPLSLADTLYVLADASNQKIKGGQADQTDKFKLSPSQAGSWLYSAQRILDPIDFHVTSCMSFGTDKFEEKVFGGRTLKDRDSADPKLVVDIDISHRLFLLLRQEMEKSASSRISATLAVECMQKEIDWTLHWPRRTLILEGNGRAYLCGLNVDPAPSRSSKKIPSPILKQDRICSYTKKSSGQQRLILSELADGIFHWVEQHDEGEDELRARLINAADLLEKVKHSTSRRKPRSQTDEANYEKMNHASDGQIWTNDDPRDHPIWLFENGRDLNVFAKIDLVALWSTIKTYLESPWLKSAQLEFIFASALIFETVVEFGEDLRMSLAAEGPKTFLGKNRFESSKPCSLSELYLLASEDTLNGIDFSLVPRALLKWTGITSSYGKSSQSPIFKMLTTYVTGARIWTAMLGRVINPSVLKQQLLSEQLKPPSEFPIYWSHELYSLIDLWIQRNPAVFLASKDKS